ncbi:MAG: hypothetical protein A2Z76_04725 [Chloroflexi bacterium RBG_13_56_8b]|nr:MAG: hypothetical protein A2Z76_04725 [Chloroflexi bacterium RBG_13_56_8b]
MDLNTMRAIVRRDLKDEDAGNYRWSDDELNQHIAHALEEFSEAVPLPAKAVLPTTADSRVIDISPLTDRVMVEAVEYPLEQFPPSYPKFALWGHALTLFVDEAPDGENCQVYYGMLHTLNAEGSTIDTKHEDLVATGAEGYATVEWASYAINRVNIGGDRTPAEFLALGNEKLKQFKQELKRLGRRNKVRIRQLYQV